MKFHFSALLLAIAVVSCDHRQKKVEEAEAPYEATAVVDERLKSELFLPGELEGFYETALNAKINGYIQKIYVDIGDDVKAGQLLVELEAPELESQLEAAVSEVQSKEAMFLNSKAKFHRLMQAAKTPGAVSAFDMDLARTTALSDSLGFAASKSKLKSVKSLADYLRIVAPFDGVITERALAPGAFVGPGEKNATPILKLKNLGKLRPGKMFSGRITRMARNVAAATRSELIEVEIQNSTGQLLPGMYTHAVIPIRRPNASLVVPSSSVVTNMERSFVIRVTHGGQAKWVDVEKGQTQGQWVEVFGQLKPGDTILQKASDEVRDAQKIHVVMATKTL